MTFPSIIRVEWVSIETWLRHLAVCQKFDSIVGVSRAGLPLAVGLSFLRPESSLAILSRNGPRGEKLPRYDFGKDRDIRIEQLTRSFELTSLPGSSSQVLIVDDVATFGDTLHVAEQKVLTRHPEAKITFACYAADDERLRLARPEIFVRLQRSIAIDNEKTWISFPWNLEPLSDHERP